MRVEGGQVRAHGHDGNMASAGIAPGRDVAGPLIGAARELLQESVARRRNRNPANRWIGQRIDDPAPDLATLARGQGVEGIGPITRAEELPAALGRAVDCVTKGRPCLVDVHIEPGHGRNLSASMAERSMAKG